MIYNNNNLNREPGISKNNNFYNFTSSFVIYKKNTNYEIKTKNSDLIKRIGNINTCKMNNIVSNMTKNS